MITVLETHANGTFWVQCKYANDGEVAASRTRVSVYHPNAREDGSSGGDAHMKCPDCGKGWWIECDG